MKEKETVHNKSLFQIATKKHQKNKKYNMHANIT